MSFLFETNYELGFDVKSRLIGEQPNRFNNRMSWPLGSRLQATLAMIAVGQHQAPFPGVSGSLAVPQSVEILRDDFRPAARFSVLQQRGEAAGAKAGMRP